MGKHNIDTFNYKKLFLDSAPLMDVRAPIEFARGAFPRAINLPLMTDDERHAVGLRYKHAGQAKAIELGSELVSSDKRELRMQQWLAYVSSHPEGYLYCFRGGLRSRTVQQWLAGEGIAYPLVSGGYKAMRNYLLSSMEQTAKTTDFISLAGRTGSGKTLLLKQLPHRIDLEGLAKHRGSSFGATVSAQPSNIDFENTIAIELLVHTQNHNETVYLEDEGKMIGKACVPKALRERMQTVPIVILDTAIADRIEISLQAYVVELLAMYQQQLGAEPGFSAFAEHHRAGLGRIVKRFGGENYQKTLSLFDLAVDQHRTANSLEGYRPYIEKLLCEYYDPMYDYQIQKKRRKKLFRGTAAEILAWTFSRRSAVTEH